MAWDSVAAAAAGATATFAYAVGACRVAAARANRHEPELTRRFRRLDRRARHRLCVAIRRGRPVAREHAELARDLVAFAERIERARRIRPARRAELAITAAFVVLIVVAVWSSYAHPVVQAAALGICAAWAAVCAAVRIRNRRVLERRLQALERIHEALAE